MSTKASVNVPNLSNMLQVAIKNSIQEIGFTVERKAKETAPVDTGIYRNSIAYDSKYTITANADYSASIEYGISNPVIIRPKGKKALRFVTKEGQEVFAKYVKQKRRKPNPVMRNAARAVQKLVESIFKKNFARLKNVK